MPNVPNQSNPTVQFVKVDVSGEHKQPGRYQVLTSPGDAREPSTGDDSGALDADIVAAPGHLAVRVRAVWR